MNKALFIDKDGTLIKNVPYNVDAELVCLEKFAGPALRILKENGYLIIVISNQSGVAHGFFKEPELEQVNVEIQYQLLPFNVQVDGFYYCTHLAGAAVEKYNVDCNCRKPKPGLILKAVSEYDIDVRSSWMIGDILNDVEAGKQAGCKTILLENGNETEWFLNEKRRPDFTATDLLQAADIILGTEKTTEDQLYDKHMV